MSKAFESFLSQVRQELSPYILSMYEFGSRGGEMFPRLSDIDLFIIVHKRSDIRHVLSIIRQIEKATFVTSHSQLTDFLEEELFASNDFTGVHPIVLSRDELDAHYNPKSPRLKILTGCLVSKDILFYHLKHGGRLLMGEDILRYIHFTELSFKDRLAAFLPEFLLLAILPIMQTDEKQFKIWCFKILNYHLDAIHTYIKVLQKEDDLKLQGVGFDDLFMKHTRRYRYNPTEYKGSRIKLYTQTWLSILKNLPFLWRI